MQGDKERPPVSGRPSLLSTEAPADAARASVFDGLERRPGAAAPVRKRGRNKLALAGGCAAALALLIGVGAWINSETNPPLTLPPAASNVAPAPATAVAAATPAVPAPAPAATIVEETAAVSPLADNTRSLKEMLNDTPAKPPRDELTAALEKPHAAPVKLAEHKKTDKPARKPVQVAKKSEAQAKPKAAQPDSDVTLLAALMTHVQAAKPTGKETSTPGYQLKQCSRMNEAGAAQCREHLCSTTARKEPECKQQPVAVKTASES